MRGVAQYDALAVHVNDRDCHSIGQGRRVLHLYTVDLKNGLQNHSK